MALMTVFAAVCIAETRGVPLDAMRELWRRHWFWKGALVLTGAGGEARTPSMAAMDGDKPYPVLDEERAVVRDTNGVSRGDRAVLPASCKINP